MRTNRRFWIIVTAILALISAWASYQLLHLSDVDELKGIYVILDDHTNDPYGNYRRGLKQAAKDFRVKLSFITSHNKTKAVNKALKKGATGIILEPNLEPELPKLLEENAATTRFVLLDSDVEPQGIYPLSAADNGEIAARLMGVIKEDYIEENRLLSGKRIALVYANANELSIRERRNHFVDQMDKNGMILATEIRSEKSMADKLRSMLVIHGMDLVVALDNPATEICANVLNEEQLGEEMPLYGVGYSEPVVYFLDKEVVDALILPNEFYLGYQAVEKLRQSIYADTGRLRSTQTSALSHSRNEPAALFAVQKETMFREDMEKIVFPME